MGFPPQPGYMFVRLLGCAYLALCVGYALGLRASLNGVRAPGPIWAGIVSNGGACGILVYFGVKGEYPDLAHHTILFGPRYKALLEEILQLIHVDALALDCVAEVEHARTILTRGTSAHRQIEVYDKAVAEGAERQEALKSVVDLLIEESMAGIA